LVGEVALEKIYTLAIRNKYRFFSFGDAMFIY
jgi:S-adenosylmethionine:tRNA-ribosyltransferase-isomerase (queuine synthetase)